MNAAYAERPLEAHAFFQRLIALPYVDAVYLTGSRANGTAHPRANLNLAISSPRATHEEWNTILVILEDADTLLHLEAIRLDAAHPPAYLEGVKRNMVKLYERR